MYKETKFWLNLTAGYKREFSHGEQLGLSLYLEKVISEHMDGQS